MGYPASATGICSRRGFLGRAVRLGLATTGRGLQLPFAARVLAQSERYEGRLIDVHCHLYADEYSDYDGLMGIFDAARVDGCWLFGHPWMLAADAWLAHPSRIVPFLSETYSTAVHPHSSYVNPGGLEDLLAGGLRARSGGGDTAPLAFPPGARRWRGERACQRCSGGPSPPAGGLPSGRPVRRASDRTSRVVLQPGAGAGPVVGAGHDVTAISSSAFPGPARVCPGPFGHLPPPHRPAGRT